MSSMVVRRGPYLVKHWRAAAMIRWRVSPSLSPAGEGLFVTFSRYRPASRLTNTENVCESDNCGRRVRNAPTPRPRGPTGMKTRARLMVGLLAAALTATACGSRLQTGELQAANGVLTRHTTDA